MAIGADTGVFPGVGTCFRERCLSGRRDGLCNVAIRRLIRTCSFVVRVRKRRRGELRPLCRSADVDTLCPFKQTSQGAEKSCSSVPVVLSGGESCYVGEVAEYWCPL